jgi:putative colanic acid biosynthesis glycosyltransferase WcaI
VPDEEVSRARLPIDEYVRGVRVIRVRSCLSESAAIPLRALHQVLLTLGMLRRVMTQTAPDALVIYSPPLPLALIGGLMGSLRHVPCILNLHDLYPGTAIELGALRNRFVVRGAYWLEKLAYQGATAIVVAHSRSAAILVGDKGVPAHKVRHIPNWVDTASITPGRRNNRFRAIHNLDGRFVISYAGLMGFAQDLSSVIQCARRMHTARDVTFLLVGDGVRLARWRQMAVDLDNVRFLHSLGRADYYDLLGASDVCLVPLTADLQSPAVPGKLQSIMAAGRSAVAIVNQESDTARVIGASGCGMVVVPGDVDGLQAALEEIKADEGLKERLGDAGRHYAETHFDLRTATDQFEKVLIGAQR